MDFLNEAEAVTAIRALLAEACEARLAVAFWGAGAADSLQLDRPGLDVSILCNLDSGACNPAEVSTLLDFCNAGKLKSLPRLHAKVYWTPQGAVVGSSNASTNGLVEEGAKSAGLSEANILIRDPSTLSTIKRWFESQWEDEASYVIGKSDINAAAEIWARRKRAAPSTHRVTRDLLKAYRYAPENPGWERVRVLLYSDPIDAVGLEEMAAERARRPYLVNYDAYQDWKAIRAGEQIIEFRFSDSEAAFQGYFKSPNPKEESQTLTFVRKISGIGLANAPLLQMSADDIAFVEAHMPAIRKALKVHEKSGVRVTLKAFVHAMEKANASPAPTDKTEQAKFHALLMETLQAGRAKGAKLNGFKRMLANPQGLDIARELLDRPLALTGGFTDLCAVGLPERSVEALALRPEWQDMFTPEQRAEAQRRLRAEKVKSSGKRSPD